ncbi:hypothetical protein ACEYW6_06970 [Nostoc sp. UIC 10607]|uniref:hypothetical protein n=1 Tax=Nostoc sp. UIC 10607 TaxID=3045935 RepID=UPI00399F568F
MKTQIPDFSKKPGILFVTDELEKLQLGVFASGLMLRVIRATLAPITPKLIELVI